MNTDLQVSDRAPVESWGDHFILTASEGWGCGEAYMKHISGVEWVTATTARAMIAGNAKYTDLFDTAEIDAVISQTEQQVHTTNIIPSSPTSPSTPSSSPPQSPAKNQRLSRQDRMPRSDVTISWPIKGKPF